MVGRRGAVVVAALGGLATLTWVAVAVAVSGRGLGPANEGYYLLSYRWWDQNPRDFAGSQYLYGPVFHLLGQDIGAIRLVRLATVVVTHAVLGWTYLRWLRARVAAGPTTRWWEVAGALVGTGAAAVAYGWLPATPGYNDVTLLGELLLVSCVLVAHRRLEEQGRVPWWTGAVVGFVVGAMLLAKPPSVGAVVLLLALAGLCLRRVGAWGLVRCLAWVAAGLAGFALVIQVAVKPLPDAVPPILESIGIVSSSSHPLGETIGFYVTSSLELLLLTLVVAGPTLLVLGVLGLLPPRSERTRTVAVLAGLAVTLVLVVVATGVAGPAPVLGYTAALVALALLVLTTSLPRPWSWRRATEPDALVRVLVGGGVVVQGLGTNNPLYAIVVNGAAAWVLLVVGVVLQRPPALRVAFLLPVIATVAAVAVAVSVGVRQLVVDGDGRPLVAAPLAHVDGLPAVASVRVPEAQARDLAAWADDLAPYVDPPGRPMLAYGELPHLVLALGGHPIGNTWFESYDTGLNAADVRAACRDGNPWGDRQPLVLADREPRADEVAAWDACGIDFERDYVDVTPASSPDGVRVLAQR